MFGSSCTAQLPASTAVEPSCLRDLQVAKAALEYCSHPPLIAKHMAHCTKNSMQTVSTHGRVCVTPLNVAPSCCLCSGCQGCSRWPQPHTLCLLVAAIPPLLLVTAAAAALTAQHTYVLLTYQCQTLLHHHRRHQDHPNTLPSTRQALCAAVQTPIKTRSRAPKLQQTPKQTQQPHKREGVYACACVYTRYTQKLQVTHHTPSKTPPQPCYNRQVRYVVPAAHTAKQQKQHRGALQSAALQRICLRLAVGKLLHRRTKLGTMVYSSC